MGGERVGEGVKSRVRGWREGQKGIGGAFG